MTASSPNVITRRDAWQSAWRLAAGDGLLAAGLIGLSLLLAAAAVLPQAPQADPAAYARWLSDAQLRFGGATSALTALGLFDVTHSLLFRAAAGVLAFCLLMRFVESVLRFRAAASPSPPPDSPARARDSRLSVEALAGRLRGWRVTRTDAFTAADRRPWTHAGALAAHAGALVMLAGLAVSPSTDWRADAVNALPGAAAQVPGTPYTLQVVGIDAAGQVDLALAEGDRTIARGVAALGRPMIGAAASVFVRDLQPALRVQGRDADGQILDLQTSARGEPAQELLLAFDANLSDEFFVAPRARLAVRVSRLEGDGEARYQILVLNASDARRVAEAIVRPGDEVAAGGFRFTFAAALHAELSITHAPAQIVIVAGLAVCLIGLALAAAFPDQRLWVAPTDSGARLASDDPLARLDRVAGEEP